MACIVLDTTVSSPVLMVRRHGWRIILLLTPLAVVGIGIRMRRRLISRLMDFRSLALLLLKGRFWLVLLVSRLLRWWCRWNTRKAIVYDVLMTMKNAPVLKITHCLQVLPPIEKFLTNRVYSCTGKLTLIRT